MNLGTDRASFRSMTMARLSQTGAFLVERYELLKELGRGGCAIVFEAHDHRLARSVALKFPVGAHGGLPKVGRFGRESRVIASIYHPNVCTALDSGETPDGVPFLVMERLFGESLRETLERIQRLRVHDAIGIGLQLLSGLGAVHEAGIVHRDVKPDNVVLVTRRGCEPLVKLLDFGLCRQASRRGLDDETMTYEGSLVGTPEYMAPEQIMGTAAVDERADIYAVGALLYESLTGTRAFYSKNVRDILKGVMTKPVRPIRELRPDVPRSLEATIARAMDRSPSRRQATVEDMQHELLDARVDAEVSTSKRIASGTR
jgi:serine/threonine protein kinase